MMAPSPSKTPSFILSVTDDDDQSPPSTDAPKSQCSSLSDGESFECFGENDAPDSKGVDLVLIPHNNNNNSNNNNNNNTTVGSDEISRHSWSSLRRTPAGHHENLTNRRWGSMRQSGRRQLGSNALASQLYRSSSFNSSGRSSNCDTEDMYSDVSLEDVQDLNHKVSYIYIKFN